MGINTALWWPICMLLVAAIACLEIERRLSLRSAGAVIEAITGAFGVLFALGAGAYVPQTFIGRDMLPYLVGLDPTVRVVLSVGAFVGVIAIVLAFIPGKWSNSIAVGPPIVFAVALMPALLDYAFGGGLMDLARSIVDLGREPAAAISRWAL